MGGKNTYHMNELQEHLASEEIVVQHFEDMAIQMHTHDFIEIAFVEKGNGWHTQGENVSRCGRGCLYLINYGDAHMYVSETDQPFHMFNLIFRPAFFDSMLQGKQSFADILNHFLLRTFRYDGLSHSFSAYFEEQETRYILALFQRMHCEYRKREQGYEELLRAWTIELLVYVFRKLRDGKNVPNVIPPPKTAVFNKVFDYIQAHYNETISLATLAELTYLSPKYFSELFKVQVGCTVTEYVQKIRIYCACELLRATNDSVLKIAGAVGYNDTKYFTMIFKRQLGIAPTQYRNRQK